MANNIFKPYQILSSQLNTLPISAGQFIFTTDTNLLYIDISDTQRISVSVPIAGTDSVGGIKVGSGLSISDGVLSTVSETGNVSSDIVNSIMVVDELPETEEENVLYLVKESEIIEPDDGNLYDPSTAPVLNAYISTGSKVFATSENEDKSTYLQIEPNTTYKITKLAGAKFSIGTCPEEPSSYTNLTVAQKNENGSEQTITSGESDNYLAIFYYTGGQDTLTEEELRNSITVIEVQSSNLWKNATIMHEYFLDTDKIILDYKDGVNYYSAYIPCESNTQYKITRTMDGYRFRIANTSVTPAQGVSYNNFLKADSLKDIDYTTSSDAQYLVIYYVGSSETLDPTALFNDISVMKVS